MANNPKNCPVCGEKGTTRIKMEFDVCGNHNEKDVFKKELGIVDEPAAPAESVAVETPVEIPAEITPATAPEAPVVHPVESTPVGTATK